MNRDEFIALPASVALGILWDTAKLAERLANVEPPKLARPPKYDAAIYRKDGIQWASETDAEGLRFWCVRYLESAAKGGEYAAKDEKRASVLKFWVEWRAQNPAAIWSGERNRDQVTARPPSGKPTVHPKTQREAPRATTEAPDFDDEPKGYTSYSVGDNDDADLPF